MGLAMLKEELVQEDGQGRLHEEVRRNLNKVTALQPCEGKSFLAEGLPVLGDKTIPVWSGNGTEACVSQ
jgi:hypothetical protein